MDILNCDVRLCFRRNGKNYLGRWFDAHGYGEAEIPDWFTCDALTIRP